LSAIISLVPLVFGIVFAVLSSQLGLGTFRNPGAGMWPFISSLIIVVASALALISHRKDKDYEHFTAQALYVLAAVASMLLFIFLLDKIGIMLCCLLLLLFWLKVLGKSTWKSTIIAGAITLAIIYGVFVFALKLPFPEAEWLIG
jgi:putative tricarboxylic transport membrane protein